MRVGPSLALVFVGAVTAAGCDGDCAEECPAVLTVRVEPAIPYAEGPLVVAVELENRTGECRLAGGDAPVCTGVAATAEGSGAFERLRFSEHPGTRFTLRVRRGEAVVRAMTFTPAFRATERGCAQCREADDLVL